MKGKIKQTNRTRRTTHIIAKIRVPEDVQIIGYDGVPDYNSGALPCSTIVQPIPLMAETAVNLILRDGESSAPVNICLPVHFAFGGTTNK